MTVSSDSLPGVSAPRRPAGGRLLGSLTAGLVIGIIDIPVEISLAALVFSGALAGYVASGIGFFLFSALVLGIVVALTSSLRGMVALPQDSAAAILAVMAASVAAQMPASAAPDDTFATVVAAIAITSLLAGVLFLILGRTRLGTLVRYIPYPVVGGFLAGTGWLLVRGALGVLIDSPMSLALVPALFKPDMLLRWLPALAFAVLLLAILRRRRHWLMIPGLLLAAIGVFYVLLRLTGTPVAQASAQGWLLGPLPAGAIWQPLLPAGLVHVYWPAVLAQAGNIATVLLVSVVSLLLHTSGLELATRRDIDLNRDLQAAGLGNLLAGLGGGPVGYQTLSLSALGHRLHGDSRLTGVVTGLACGAMLLFGAPLLSFFPKPVLGGLLLFLGMSFLVEWVYDAWFRLSRAEYAVVLAILLAMSALGVLPGVALGLMLAVVLFVVNYSRVSVVKHALSGANYRSNVDRSAPESAILDREGSCIDILELQGFIFFGTASGLVEWMRRSACREERPPRFVVLDFRQVCGLDASAVSALIKMKQVAEVEGMVLVFTRLSDQMRRQLSQEVLTEADQAIWHVEPDLDHGVEWCEEQMLATAGALAQAIPATDSNGPGASQTVNQQTELLARMQEFLERMTVPQGTVLIRQGDPPAGLYLVEQGQVSVELATPAGEALRLRKMGPGTVVGEMSVYRGAATSATVTASQPSTVLFLSRESLARLEEERPDLAIALHRYVAQLLGERLERANETVEAVLR